MGEPVVCAPDCPSSLVYCTPLYHIDRRTRSLGCASSAEHPSPTCSRPGYIHDTPLEISCAPSAGHRSEPVADREVSMAPSHHSSAALGAGKATTELGVPCSTSAGKRQDESLHCVAAQKSRAAEVLPEMGQDQATGSGRASGHHVSYENSAEPSTVMRPQDTGSSLKSATHAPAEQPRQQMADTSPGEDLDMTGRASWQPYARKAGAQSMDLDAICMPHR